MPEGAQGPDYSCIIFINWSIVCDLLVLLLQVDVLFVFCFGNEIFTLTVPTVIQ